MKLYLIKYDFVTFGIKQWILMERTSIVENIDKYLLLEILISLQLICSLSMNLKISLYFVALKKTKLKWQIRKEGDNGRRKD